MRRTGLRFYNRRAIINFIMKNLNKAPLVCSACGAIILFTGVVTHIISHDIFSLILIISGAIIILSGIIWLAVTVKTSEKLPVTKNSERIDNYLEFFARLAKNAGLLKIYKRKIKKFGARLNEIVNCENDANTRAFAAYLYYVYDMDARFKNYPYETVVNCIYEILQRDEKEVIIDNIPEGITFCGYIEKTLKTNFK